MSENVIEEFNAKSMQALQASIMVAQELMRVINARFQAGELETQRQVQQVKALTDIALDNAREVTANLSSEKFYALASKTDLYDAYVTAHSFAFDEYCARQVEYANRRLGLDYAPGTLTDSDCESLKKRLRVEGGVGAVKARVEASNEFKRFYQAQYKVKQDNPRLSFVDRVKAARGFDRGVLIMEGGLTKRLSEVVAPLDKPIPPSRGYAYNYASEFKKKSGLKF